MLIWKNRDEHFNGNINIQKKKSLQVIRDLKREGWIENITFLLYNNFSFY